MTAMSAADGLPSMSTRRRRIVVGFCRGDFLDVHAAFGGEQDQRLARGNVMQDGGIEFARNFGLLLDQHALDRIVADAHAENLAGHLLRFVRSGGELDAAGLAALAGRHLRLDDARPDIRGRHGRFGRADAERAARHRNAGRRQNQRFCSVFLEVHRNNVPSFRDGAPLSAFTRVFNALWPDPESRSMHGACLWIPGSRAKARAPE